MDPAAFLGPMPVREARSQGRVWSYPSPWQRQVSTLDHCRSERGGAAREGRGEDGTARKQGHL